MENKKQPLFIGMLITLSLLFLLNGYSLVQVLYQEDWENNFGLYILEAIYLVLHFAFIGIIFYLNFRAYKLGPQLLPGLTLTKNDEINKKSTVLAGIFGLLFLLIGIYGLLVSFNLNLPFAFIFSGLSYDLFNGCFLLYFIALEIFLYPFLYKKKLKSISDA